MATDLPLATTPSGIEDTGAGVAVQERGYCVVF